MHDEDPEEGVRDLVEMALKKLVTMHLLRIGHISINHIKIHFFKITHFLKYLEFMGKKNNNHKSIFIAKKNPF